MADNINMIMIWHAAPPEVVPTEPGTDLHPGTHRIQARAFMPQHGPNQLPEPAN